MTTKEREQARRTNRQAAHYTEVWIVGSADEIRAIVHAAYNCGALAYASAPVPMGGDDPRYRRYLRLRTR